jgi:membrane-associated phospholipid phosphatase
MDAPTDQSTPTSGPRLQPGTLRSVGRRRPSGEPPPLPHHLQISGVGWLLAAAALTVLVIVAFGRGMRGPAVAVTVADDAVVRWLAGLHAPGLGAVTRVLAGLSSWWVLNGLLAGLVLALLALRRFRHLVVLLVFANVVVLFAGNMVGATARRPRPFGVAIQTGWGGWALPSLQVTFFATALVALVALTGLGRIALGADAPTDVLVGAAIGVTIPLLAFRWFAPSRVFPVAYRRGRSAHLDVGGARGQAIRQAMQDQLDLAVQDIKPFGLAGSAGSTPLRIQVKGDPPTILFAKLYARSHLRTPGGREAVQHRAATGAAGGLRPAAVPRRRAALPKAVRVRGADSRAGVPAGHRVLRRGGGAGGGRGR